jgi:cytochrome c
MDGFELNKIMGAVLGTCLFILSVNIVAGAVFTGHVPEKPGFVVEVPEAGEGTKQAAPQEAAPIAVRLASADAGKGEAAAKKCLACHSFEKGGPNKVGPNLYDVYMNKHAHTPGFSYSAAMKSQDGQWTAEALDAFIANPRAAIKGTTMAFAGIRRPEERADVIAYLQKLSDSPKPLPKPTQDAKAPDAAKGAEPAAKAPAPAKQ